jgi:cell division septum initiation protein DivIVA
MSVTTEQVTGSRFATVKRGGGYDVGDVDRHIEAAERAAADLVAKNTGLEESNTALRAALVTANERVRMLEEQLTGALAESREAAAVVAPVIPIVQDPVRTASLSASKMLERATRDAEALVIGAREEADQVVAQARAEAAQAIQTCLTKVHAREEALDAMVEEQRVELDRTRKEALRELEGRRTELNNQVDQLTDFEDRIRTHLVSYFSEQLETLAEPIIAETLVIATTEHPQAS